MRKNILKKEFTFSNNTITTAFNVIFTSQTNTYQTTPSSCLVHPPTTKKNNPVRDVKRLSKLNLDC